MDDIIPVAVLGGDNDLGGFFADLFQYGIGSLA